MSTTFVLHGGQSKVISPQNNEFFARFTSLVDKEEVRILMCYFSREKTEWQALFERDTKRVVENTEKKVDFHLLGSPADLQQKIDSYDVLYVSGGDAPPIEAIYADMKWLKEKLEGKVYLGSSMGAFMVSEKYVLSYDSQDVNTVHTGLGILPINTLVHWDKEENKEQKIKLLQSNSDLPIITLEEGESVTIIN